MVERGPREDNGLLLNYIRSISAGCESLQVVAPAAVVAPERSAEHGRESSISAAGCGSRTRREHGAYTEIRPRRSRYLRRDRRCLRIGAYGRVHERRRAGEDHCDRGGVVLLQVARPALAQR